jgi:hypothetical protein
MPGRPPLLERTIPGILQTTGYPPAQNWMKGSVHSGVAVGFLPVSRSIPIAGLSVSGL